MSFIFFSGMNLCADGHYIPSYYILAIIIHLNVQLALFAEFQMK